jgi:hypothetical protein
LTRRACFLLEAPQATLILGIDRRQDLNRNFTPNSSIMSAIYLTHSANADQTDDFIRAKTRASRYGHEAYYPILRPRLPIKMDVAVSAVAAERI